MQGQLRKRSNEILRQNIYDGKNDFGYTAASGNLYPFQWLWDTFFVSAWNTNLVQSEKDIGKFLKSQRTDGFLGHIRYNKDILKNKDYFPRPDIYYYNQGGLPESGEIISKITQPPNIAYGLYELSKKITDITKRKELLKKYFDKIYLYHKYLAENLSIDGMLVVIHPWQAGDDNSPRWDKVYENIEKIDGLHGKMENWLKSLELKYERIDLKLVHPRQRPTNSHYDIYLYLIWLYGQWNWDEKKILAESPFRVLDPLTNSIWVRSNLCLEKIATDLGRTSELANIKEWKKAAIEGLEKLYDSDLSLYLTKDLSTQKFDQTGTVSGLMPLFSLEIKKDRVEKLVGVIQNLIKANSEFWQVPSTFFDQKNIFDPICYWRGPVWIIINTLLVEGLLYYGFKKEAQKIKLDSLNLVYKSLELDKTNNFFEYYNPITGQGLGSPSQSWTAAAVLKLLSIEF